MFIPATPDSKLAKLIEEEVKSSGVKIKVVERAGIKVKKLLQKNDPFKGKKCEDSTCFVCSTTNSGNCRKSGITYGIMCKGD